MPESRNTLSKNTPHPSSRTKALGTQGEEIAENYLLDKGYRLYLRNWSCKVGEFDLIMFDGVDLVFVEVKTRLSSPYTDRYLFDSINYYKQRKLKTLAQLFISFHCKHRPPPPYRIDVVGVLLERGGKEIKKIEHLVSAI